MENDPLEAEAAEAMRRISDEESAGMSAEERLDQYREPETAAVRHGLYMRQGAYLLCDRCPVAEHCELYRPGKRCMLEIVEVPKRRKQIRAVVAGDGHDPELYTALIDSYLWSELRLARAIRFCGEHGELKDGAPEYHGVAREIPALQRALSNRAEDLNLTPAARAKLDAQRSSGPLSAPGEQQARQTLAIDAEFEAADDDRKGDGDDGA